MKSLVRFPSGAAISPVATKSPATTIFLPLLTPSLHVTTPKDTNNHYLSIPNSVLTDILSKLGESLGPIVEHCCCKDLFCNYVHICGSPNVLPITLDLYTTSPLLKHLRKNGVPVSYYWPLAHNRLQIPFHYGSHASAHQDSPFFRR